MDEKICKRLIILLRTLQLLHNTNCESELRASPTRNSRRKRGILKFTFPYLILQYQAFVASEKSKYIDLRQSVHTRRLTNTALIIVTIVQKIICHNSR